VSASTFTDTTEAALEAGCVALVAKPIRAEVLYSIIQQHVGVVFLSGRHGTPLLSSSGAPTLAVPPGAARFAGRLRDAAALGDIGAVGAIESELAGEPGMGVLSRRLADLRNAFDFDGLRRLADWLESPGDGDGPLG
jgi:hypothetical protein